MNSIFAKISSRENISNSLFAKISSRENKVLYSRPRPYFWPGGKFVTTIIIIITSGVQSELQCKCAYVAKIMSFLILLDAETLLIVSKYDPR